MVVFGRAGRSDQGQQLGPKHRLIPLVQKVTSASALGEQLESDGGKTDLFHAPNLSDAIKDALTLRKF